MNIPSSKGIDLEKKKKIKKKKFMEKNYYYFDIFYISHENDIKTFLKWFINKENVNEIPKGIC